MSFEAPKPEQSEEDIPSQEKIEERLENATKVFDDYLNLEPGERVVFVNDKDTDVELKGILQQELVRRGAEFRDLFADEHTTQKELFEGIKDSQLVWNSWTMMDTKIPFHKLTNFIEEEGKRMVFSPGLQAESLENDGALAEDKEALDERLGKMERKLHDVHGFHIRTEYGTDLTVRMKHGERRWFKENGAVRPGGWNNLPGGEIFTTPDEEHVDGVLVLPVLQDEITMDQGVDAFVRLTIRGGKIAKIDGGESAEKLREYIHEQSKAEKRDPTSVLQCAEIAFGANSKARTVVSHSEGFYTDETNPTTETEKRLGTIHIAFGGAKHGEEGTEGHTETESEMHVDFVIPRHSLTVTAFKSDEDFEKKRNGDRLINDGSWNFV